MTRVERPARVTPVLDAAFALASVWTLVALGGLAERAGSPLAVPASFAAAAAWLVATRPRDRTRTRADRDPLVVALGATAGVCTCAALSFVVLVVGLAAGLAVEPPPPGARPPRPLPAPAHAVAALCLAPAFEELLYRERIPRALGAAPRALRVALPSALFAIPHVDPWRVLGAFATGLALAGTRERSGALALCVALHAGLNLAALSGAAAPGAVPLCVVGVPAWGAAVRRARALGAEPGRRRDVAGGA